VSLELDELDSVLASATSSLSSTSSAGPSSTGTSGGGSSGSTMNSRMSGGSVARLGGTGQSAFSRKITNPKWLMNENTTKAVKSQSRLAVRPCMTAAGSCGRGWTGGGSMN
jgi:hypothetical protein